MKKGTLLHQSLTILILSILFVIFIFPSFWMFTTSLKPNGDITSAKPVWIPTQLTWENYEHVVYGYPGTEALFQKYLFNSGVAALTSTLVSVILGTIAGYSFSRFKFRGKDSIFLGLILTRCVPGIALSLPLLILFGSLGLADTLLGLIIVYSCLDTPFVTWMMEGFFAEVPRELDEAAYIDGCSMLGTFMRVDLPLAMAGIMSSAALAFLLAWVEYPISFVLTSSIRSRTVPPGIFTFMTEFHIDWGGLSAAATIITIPALIFIVITQRYVLRGLTFGAVKG